MPPGMSVGLAPSLSQDEWNDQGGNTFPIIDDDNNSVAASELTMDTFFRNQENNSHNSKDRSWSAFLGFGSGAQQQTQSPPVSPTHQGSSNRPNSSDNNVTRSSSFFGFTGYGSFNQSSTPNANQRPSLDAMGGSGDNMDDVVHQSALGVEGSISQQSSGVKPTRLQQQQASLLMRTQRSMRTSSGNNTPLVDPLARPGSFRAMRSPSINTPASSASPAVSRTPQPNSAALMMVDTGESDALCDIYPSQEDQMFEEMKFGIPSSSGAGGGKAGAATTADGRFVGQNPAMKQIRNRNMLNGRTHSAMSSSMGSSHPSTPSVTSDFYISSSTDDEHGGGFSTNNSLSPKSPVGGRSGASFNNPAPYYRSQSAPIQTMQQSSVVKDSPSVGKGSAYPDHYTGGKSNRDIDMQNPMNLKKAYAQKAAQMARSGTAAGAAASAAALANANGDRPGAVKVASTDESDMEYAIMLSLQEEQKRKQLEEAERKAIEEAMQRSTFNTRPSIRLLQSKYYNSR